MPLAKILPFDKKSLYKGDIVQLCITSADGVTKALHSLFYLGNSLYISAFGYQEYIKIHELEEGISKYPKTNMMRIVRRDTTKTDPILNWTNGQQSDSFVPLAASYRPKTSHLATLIENNE